jgi:hypothetical protein
VRRVCCVGWGGEGRRAPASRHALSMVMGMRGMEPGCQETRMLDLAEAPTRSVRLAVAVKVSLPPRSDTMG